MSQNNVATQVLCFGEVLWDIMPDKRLPGGAPMNVAYHLKQLGIPVMMLSCVGQDKEGEELMAFMSEKGIDISNIQVHEKLLTGSVPVTRISPTEMRYEITMPVAWDEIQWPEDGIEEDTTAIVYGSLAARSSISRDTLHALIDSIPVKVMDVNMRPPYVEKEIMLPLLEKATILKMNEEELGKICQWWSDSEMPANGHLKEQISLLLKHLSPKAILVSKGSAGAMLWQEGKFYEQSVFPVQVADTIGSGDSFLAAYLSQYLKGVPPQESLRFACAMGALVASKSGGCPNYFIEEVEGLMLKVENGE